MKNHTSLIGAAILLTLLSLLYFSFQTERTITSQVCDLTSSSPAAPKEYPHTNSEWAKLRKEQSLQAYEFYMSKEFDIDAPMVYELYQATYECDRNQMVRVGSQADGGKWFCGEFLNPSEKCVIFSLGSNGDFSFERAISEKYTDCKVHTFDCTGSWSDSATEFHPWCLASRTNIDNGRIYKTWSQILRDVSIKKVDYLKIDIECFEFEVIPVILMSPESELPSQIAIEIHEPKAICKKYFNGTNVKTLTSFMKSFEEHGYQIASNEPNLQCKFCCEFVFVRPSILY